jgi:heme-degrading monooxygenase HmoA
MFARVTTSQGSTEPDRAEAAQRYAQEQLLPRLRQQPGFRNWYVLLDPQTGKGISITVWDSEAAMQASEELGASTRAQASRDLGLQQLGVEHYQFIVVA